jgi:hypothetical protein
MDNWPGDKRRPYALFGAGRRYPTQKPLALLERIIKASSNANDIADLANRMPSAAAGCRNGHFPRRGHFPR